MATARDIVTAALRKLRVTAMGEEPEASEMAAGLEDLNGMLADWRNDGIDLNHIDLEAGDTLDVPDDHLQTIRLSLAERLGSDYGAQVSPMDAAAAERGRSALRAIYFQMADLTSDNPLRRNNLSRRWPH